jgi:hypothetical protein
LAAKRLILGSFQPIFSMGKGLINGAEIYIQGGQYL